MSISTANELKLQKAGYIPVLIDLSERVSDEKIAFHSLCCLRNLASNQENKDQILKKCDGKILVEILKSSPLKIKVEAIGLLAILATSKSSNLVFLLPMILDIMGDPESDEMFAHSAAVVSNLAGHLEVADAAAMFIQHWERVRTGVMILLVKDDVLLLQIGLWTIWQLIQHGTTFVFLSSRRRSMRNDLNRY